VDGGKARGAEQRGMWPGAMAERKAGGRRSRARGCGDVVIFFTVPEEERIREPRGHRGPPAWPSARTDVLNKA
jgi:hypothetical protein